MSYLTQDAIANSRSMLARVAQCAAQEGKSSDPDRWTYDTRRLWSSSPGWDASWESALVSHPEPEYDPGADMGCITDGMILAQVQSMGTMP